MQLNETQWLHDAGIDVGLVKMPQGLGGLYPDPMHAENHEAAMDLSEQIPLELRQQIADRMGLIGTPEDCIERLKVVSKAGYDSVFMRTVDTISFPASEVEAFGAKIGPAITSLP